MEQMRNYKVPVCTTEYQFVFQSASLRCFKIIIIYFYIQYIYIIVCISLFSVCGSPVPLILCAPSVFVFCVHCLVFFVWPHGIELCMPDTSLILCAPLCLNVFCVHSPCGCLGSHLCCPEISQVAAVGTVWLLLL